MTTGRAAAVLTWLNSPRGWMLLGVLAAAGVFLATRHATQLLGILPFALLLVCPLLHLFVHGGHGQHVGHGQPTTGEPHRGEDR